MEVLDVLQLPDIHKRAKVCRGRWDCPRFFVRLHVLHDPVLHLAGHWPGELCWVPCLKGRPGVIVLAAPPEAVGLHLLFLFLWVMFILVQASDPQDDGRREPVLLSFAKGWASLLLFIDLPGFLVPVELYLPLDVLVDADPP